MSVYVDQFPPGWGKWSGGGHLLGSDIDELHALAKKIGLRRDWFQGNETFAHYDVTQGKRAQALAAGAIPIEIGELPNDVLMRRTDGTYEQRCVRIARRNAEKEAGGS